MTNPASPTSPATAPVGQPGHPLLPTAGRQRFTRELIQKRRHQVWELFCCGQSAAEIAKEAKVSVKTIERDLDWWEKKLGLHTKGLKNPDGAAADVGKTAKKLQKIAEDAYVEYVAASHGPTKAKFLQTSMQALVLRHKILADAGYLPKVGHEKEEAPSVSISFEARFGKDAPEAVFDDPKSRRRVLEAAFKILGTGMLNDVGTVGEAMNPTPIQALPAPADDEEEAE